MPPSLGMPLELHTGDLFAAPGLPALGHGCNCAGAMGRGIAVQFRQRYPAMYEAYRRRCLAGTFLLGDVFVWDAESPVIFNLGTQTHWIDRASLTAIFHATRQMLACCEARRLPAVGIPRIGAGLGGLSWPTVAGVLSAVAASSPVRLQVFSLEKDAGEDGDKTLGRSG